MESFYWRYIIHDPSTQNEGFPTLQAGVLINPYSGEDPVRSPSWHLDSWIRFPPFRALVLWAIVLFFGKLDDGGLAEDPVQYAAVAKTLAKPGADWITLHVGNTPYFNKPPLYFWLTAILFKIFGVSVWAARWWSAAAAVGCILLFYDFVRLFRGEREGMFAALILSLTGEFFRTAPAGRLDSLQLFFILLAFWGMARAIQRPQPWAASLVGIGLSLGLLTKGPMVFAILPVLAILGLFSFLLPRQKEEEESPSTPPTSPKWRKLVFPLLIGFLAGAVIVLPWYVAVSQANPGFWDHFFGREIVKRLQGQDAWIDRTPRLPFLLKFFVRSLPWSALSLMGLGGSVLLFLQGTRIERIYSMWLVLWIAILGAMALSPAKLYLRYGLPILPPLAALAALGIHTIGKRWASLPPRCSSLIAIAHTPIPVLDRVVGWVPLATCIYTFILILLPIPRHPETETANLRTLAPILQTMVPKGEKVFCYRVDSDVLHQLNGAVYFYLGREAELLNRLDRLQERFPRVILCHDPHFPEIAPLGYRKIAVSGNLAVALSNQER